MTQYLPPNLLALFAPRDPIPYLPPTEKLPHEKKTTGYSGVAQCVQLFEEPKDTPAPVKIESRAEKLERKKREKAEQAAYKLEQGIALWDPSTNSNATLNPYKTIFVGHINYDTSESKLRREFETYGRIEKIHMVHDKVTGKPRGYAFIEFEKDRYMIDAIKHANGKKIDGRRVIVDVERGRTVKNWLPRRLGGGYVPSRRGGQEEKTSGRDDVIINNNNHRRSSSTDYRDRDRDREFSQKRTERAKDSRDRDRDRHRRRPSRSRSRSPRSRSPRRKTRR